MNKLEFQTASGCAAGYWTKLLRKVHASPHFTELMRETQAEELPIYWASMRFQVLQAMDTALDEPTSKRLDFFKQKYHEFREPAHFLAAIICLAKDSVVLVPEDVSLDWNGDVYDAKNYAWEVVSHYQVPDITADA